MELLCILLILALVVLVYIMYSRRNSERKRSDNEDSSIENLKKYFGDDFSKITGSSTVPQFTASAKKESTSPDIITPSDILNRPSHPSNNALYGNNPINDVINKKMAGANLLGITINAQRAAEMPKNPSEQLCGLISVMLAKGMGAAAKGNTKTISFFAVREGESIVISCSYPERAIPETDEKIKRLIEEMNGNLNSETVNGITTDKAIIPEKSN